MKIYITFSMNILMIQEWNKYGQLNESDQYKQNTVICIFLKMNCDLV